MFGKNDKARDQRISDEVLVDSYGEEEQMMSWYAYLDDALSFPFTAKCTIVKEISPLKKRGDC